MEKKLSNLCDYSLHPSVAEQRKEQPSEAVEALARTEADTQRLIDKLHDYQTELELQDQEHQKARDEAKTASEKYNELFDIAPAGYLSFDREGTIHEANLPAARLLGLERSRLIRQPFGLFLFDVDRSVFTAFLAEAFAKNGRRFCLLTLFTRSQPRVRVRIEALVVASGWHYRPRIKDIAEPEWAARGGLAMSTPSSTGIPADDGRDGFSGLLTVILLDLECLNRPALPSQELGHLMEAAKKDVPRSIELTQQSSVLLT